MKLLSKPHVLLRADAGPTTGYGHFIRTSALAAYLAGDFECEVLSFDTGRDSLAATNAAFLERVGKEEVVVLDNYYYDTDFQREVRSRCRALVCIDDIHDRHFVADALFSFCPLKREDFSLESYTRFFGGLEWAFLREPLLRPKVIREYPPVIRRIALAMGGADPYRLTDKMIEVLHRVLSGVPVDIIAGRNVLIGHSPDDNISIWREVDAETVADIMDHADIGIFPASTVCVEAFSRGLPVAAGYYVDNQADFYRNGTENGWFLPLGNLLDPADDIAERLSALNERHSGRESGAVLACPPDIDFNARRKDIINLFKSLSNG